MQEKNRDFSFLKQKILYYIDYKQISKHEVYTKTGITHGVLSQTNGISEENILKFLNFYTDISLDWLFFDKGNMLKDDNSLVATKAEDLSTVPALPLIPLDAMAGFCSGNESQIMEYECEKYVVPVFREAEFLIPVKGSSMYPKYSSGDIVACKKLPLKDLFFQWNKVYVLDTNQGALIKRVKKGKDENHILLISENPKYDPFELNLEQLNAIAIVIGVIRLE